MFRCSNPSLGPAEKDSVNWSSLSDHASQPKLCSHINLVADPPLPISI